MPTFVLKLNVNIEHTVLLALHFYFGGLGGGLNSPKSLGTVPIEDPILINFLTFLLNLSKFSMLLSNSSAKNCTEDSNVGNHRDEDKQIHHFIITGFCLFGKLSNYACFLNEFTILLIPYD